MGYYKNFRQNIKNFLSRYLPFFWNGLRFLKKKIIVKIELSRQARREIIESSWLIKEHHAPFSWAKIHYLKEDLMAKMELSRLRRIENKKFSWLVKKYNLNIKSAVQVGGHWGQEISFFIKHGVKTIAVFEPLKNNLKILRHQFSKNKKVIIYPLALGNDRKKIMMNVASNITASSSILTPKEHLHYAKEVSFDKTETVQMKKMDDVIEKNHGYNFLILDVQGYELEVLKGARETLKKVDYVYSEINQRELYEGCALVGDIDKFLAQYDMVRVHSEWHKEYKNSFGDGLYIRKSLLKNLNH